jgi:hypothetical protein
MAVCDPRFTMLVRDAVPAGMHPGDPGAQAFSRNSRLKPPRFTHRDESRVARQGDDGTERLPVLCLPSRITEYGRAGWQRPQDGVGTLPRRGHLLPAEGGIAGPETGVPRVC